MENLCQQDPRWADVRIGKTKTRVGDKGCTITASSMVLSQLQNRFVSPGDAAQYWAFDSSARIVWTKCNFDGMRFVRRYYSHNKQVIANAAGREDQGVVLCVNGGAHWLYLKEIRDGKYVIVDPWDGLEYEGLPSKYMISGFTVFERTYDAAPDWQAEVWRKAQAQGLQEKSPATEINMQKLEQILFDLGKIDSVTGDNTLGRWLVILDKVKQR